MSAHDSPVAERSSSFEIRSYKFNDVLPWRGDGSLGARCADRAFELSFEACVDGKGGRGPIVSSCRARTSVQNTCNYVLFSGKQRKLRDRSQQRLLLARREVDFRVFSLLVRGSCQGRF